jgi:hypothetical protein
MLNPVQNYVIPASRIAASSSFAGETAGAADCAETGAGMPTQADTTAQSKAPIKKALTQKYLIFMFNTLLRPLPLKN